MKNDKKSKDLNPYIILQVQSGEKSYPSQIVKNLSELVSEKMRQGYVPYGELKVNVIPIDINFNNYNQNGMKYMYTQAMVLRGMET